MQKFFDIININSLSNLSIRTVYKNTKEPIKNYLQGLLRKKILTKIVTNTQRSAILFQI